MSEQEQRTPEKNFSMDDPFKFLRESGERFEAALERLGYNNQSEACTMNNESTEVLADIEKELAKLGPSDFTATVHFSLLIRARDEIERLSK